MSERSGRLTVYFDDPFWVGVFEIIENEKLSVCRVTFGAEPKDGEVWEFVLKNYYRLNFGCAVTAQKKQTADNPKRRQRNAKKQLQNVGIGTKSQQALAAMREETKILRKKVGKEQKEAEKERQLEMKRKKRKEKHKGH